MIVLVILTFVCTITHLKIWYYFLYKFIKSISCTSEATSSFTPFMPLLVLTDFSHPTSSLVLNLLTKPPKRTL